MKRRPRPAALLAAILIPLAGCATEPSPLSPIAAEAPERHALALREMGDMARRNREAEAAFYRRRATARPVTPEITTNPTSTADIREKP